MLFRGSLGLVFVGLCAAASLEPAQTRSAVRRPATPAGKRGPATTVSPASVRGLSLHDRIAQLLMVRGYGDYPSSTDPEYQRFLNWIRDDRVGGFIVAGRIR